jgi:hypothetical protein
MANRDYGKSSTAKAKPRGMVDGGPVSAEEGFRYDFGPKDTSPGSDAGSSFRASERDSRGTAPQASADNESDAQSRRMGTTTSASYDPPETSQVKSASVTGTDLPKIEGTPPKKAKRTGSVPGSVAGGGFGAGAASGVRTAMAMADRAERASDRNTPANGPSPGVASRVKDLFSVKSLGMADGGMVSGSYCNTGPGGTRRYGKR